MQVLVWWNVALAVVRMWFSRPRPLSPSDLACSVT
jgi:hypothetical protein